MSLEEHESVAENITGNGTINVQEKHQDANKVKRETRNVQKKRTLIALIIAFVFAILCLSVCCAYDEATKNVEQLNNQIISSVDSINATKESVNESINTLETLLASTSDDTVDETNVLHEAREHLENAKKCVETAETNIIISVDDVSGNSFEKINKLEDIKTQNAVLSDELDASNNELETDISSINKSIERKKILDAKTALSDAVREANSVLDDSESAVLDNTNRDALASLVDKAIGMINSDTSDADSINACLSEFAPREDAVNVDVETKKLSDAYGSASRDSNPWDTWTVSYRNEYWTKAAASDGSVTQWADGYFIAHDWSSNGQRITSKPAHVIIDGKTYHYVSYFVDLKAQPFYTHISSFVYPNDGIGFQTCYGETHNLILHYEPGW